MKLTTVLIYKFNKILNMFFKVSILDTEETIELLLNNEFSISRYGDGELNLMMGGDIHFQPFNKKLAMRLKDILLNYDENSSLKIGVPLAINTTIGYNDSAKKFWEMNMNTGRMHWLFYCGIRKRFLNASFTRCYIDYKEKEKSLVWLKKIKKIWSNKKVLIVEGENSKLGYDNDLFDNTILIKRIITKSCDAWSVYEKILKTTLDIASDYDMILVSLGPTATILASDVSRKGYRILDIGHVNLEYNEFLKIKMEKKIVNNNIDFDSQIIYRIL